MRCEQNYKLSFDATACIRIQGCIQSIATNPIFKVQPNKPTTTADFSNGNGQEGALNLSTLTSGVYYHQRMMDFGDVPYLQSFRTSHTLCKKCNTNYR